MEDKRSDDITKTYERAEKIVAEKIGFLRHLMIYVLVNILLLAINLVVSTNFYWFLIPLGLWGIVLLSHFISVFIFSGEKFERWRRRQVEKEVEKLGRKD